MSPLVFILLLVAVFGVLAYWGWRAEQARRQALAAFAAARGFSFAPDKDHAMAARHGFLDRLAQGSNRYVFNRMTGRHRDYPVTVFDYHYETHSTDSKGHRQTHHHYLSCYLLELPRAFPELTLAPEGLLSKFAQMLGYDDIDFESHEFSRRFCVRARDKKFAYDVCHARMIEHWLAHPPENLEIEGAVMATVRSSRLDPERIGPILDGLADTRALLPAYLMEGA